MSYNGGSLCRFHFQLFSHLSHSSMLRMHRSRALCWVPAAGAINFSSIPWGHANNFGSPRNTHQIENWLPSLASVVEPQLKGTISAQNAAREQDCTNRAARIREPTTPSHSLYGAVSNVPNSEASRMQHLFAFVSGHRLYERKSATFIEPLAHTAKICVL